MQGCCTILCPHRKVAQPAQPLPLDFARRLTGRHRSQASNRQLGLALAFVAGAINAGGFLAVQQYTSHMTGIVSAMADDLALGNPVLVAAGLGALLAFVAGAATSALMVNFARRHQLHSEYAGPLLLEAALLLCFGLLGARLARVQGLFVPLTVLLLCFIMGLQNAVISKLSRLEIRTTHITGIVTDIGIELGKLLYWNRSSSSSSSSSTIAAAAALHAAPGSLAGAGRVLADRGRLRLLCGLAAAFFAGGLVGALGFKHVGYLSTVPLALLLVLLAGVPALDDALAWLRRAVRR